MSENQAGLGGNETGGKHRWAEVFLQFLKLGLSAFGGPVAHIAYFQREFVERKAWLSPEHFASLLALCQFLPGPASSQLGFAIGLQRAGIVGAFSAFLAFTLPSVLLLLFFVWLQPHLGEPTNLILLSSFKMLAAVVVADALLSMGKTLCDTWLKRIITVLVGSALLLQLTGPWFCILLAGLIGFLCFSSREGEGQPSALNSRQQAKGISVKLAVSFGVLFILLLILAQIPANFLGLSDDAALLWLLASELYQAGGLVFGGGHVVLPLLQEGLLTTAIVTESEFLSAYGAAQVIPGPMFSIAAYLGAVAGEHTFSALGAAVALLAIFLPGFLLLMAVLPFWRILVSNHRLLGAIGGVNSAVVGLLAASFVQPVLLGAAHSLVDAVWLIVGFCLLRFTALPILGLLPLMLVFQSAQYFFF